MCIKDSINKTCWKNGKDLSNGAPKIKLWNHTKKTHFPVFAKNFRRPCMKLKKIFCQFPNPWTLRVSGMGGYTSKCEKSQNHCTLLSISQVGVREEWVSPGGPTGFCLAIGYPIFHSVRNYSTIAVVIIVIFWTLCTVTILSRVNWERSF
jgi:hypothetical protein